MADILETTLPIGSDADVAPACDVARRMCAAAGGNTLDQTMVATAISEVVRNMVIHAQGGHVVVRLVELSTMRGVEIACTDHGPGIEDVERALRDGYSTGVGLGLGLPGARRLMDEFTITTDSSAGTSVVMRSWYDATRVPTANAAV